MKHTRIYRLLKVSSKRFLPRRCHAFASDDSSPARSSTPALFITGFFGVLFGVPGIVTVSAMFNPPDQPTLADINTLAASCQAFEATPWVQAVGWDEEPINIQHCPTLESRFNTFGEALGKHCWDAYVGIRMKPLTEFITQPDSDTTSSFFKSLYFWPAALSASAIGMDTTLKFARCSLLATADAAPLSAPERDGLKRTVNASFSIYATRAMHRRLLRGALLADPWSGLQTSALITATPDRTETVTNALTQIDKIQEQQINETWNELQDLHKRKCGAEIIELKLLLLAEQISVYLKELRADYSYSRDALRCHEAWNDLDPDLAADRAADLYQMAANSYRNQCEVSAKLTELWNWKSSTLESLKTRDNIRGSFKVRFPELFEAYDTHGSLAAAVTELEIIDDYLIGNSCPTLRKPSQRIMNF